MEWSGMNNTTDDSQDVTLAGRGSNILRSSIAVCRSDAAGGFDAGVEEVKRGDK